MSDDMLDRLALIVAAAERQREIDNRACPICGGDMLRRDYTASDRCHAQRWPEWKGLK